VNGKQRLTLGVEHENHVQAELERRGWTVQPWGQGVLDEAIRQALQVREPPCPYRWFPDLIAAKGTKVCLVDPKSDTSKTENFSVEIAAYGAHTGMWHMWGVPVIYVFDDLTCNLVHKLQPVRWIVPDPGRTRVAAAGSGTPFMLIRKSDQESLDYMFGTPEADAA